MSSKKVSANRRGASLVRAFALWASVLLAGAGLWGCGASLPATASDPLAELRRAAEDSDDGEVVGRWMLGELVVPGGETKAVVRARRRLDAIEPRPRGLYASLARGIDDEAHGRFGGAATAYLEALAAARVSQSADAPLIGWYAANHLLRLRSSVHGLWDRSRDVVELALRSPGRIGWRARGELVEWWTVDGLDDKRRGGDLGASSTLELSAKRYGCVDKARLAGPFGHMARTDARRTFAAERPGPWPQTFERDPRRAVAPRVLDVERRGCQLGPVEAAGPGIYYVETFIDVPATRDMIIAVQGSYAVWIDDSLVLSRDPAQWGIWPRFGARVRVEGGRHRILARIGGPETSIRLLSPDGQPLDATTSSDPGPPYSMTPPRILPDPNVLAPFTRALGVPRQSVSGGKVPIGLGEPNPADPIARYVAAYLAHIEGQEDISTVLMEPLVEDAERATGVSLATAAVYIEEDPIFVPGDARDLAKDLRTKAAAKDEGLWWPRLWLALDQADKAGVPQTIPQIAALADRFKEVPDILKGLISLYGRLGWEAERVLAIERAAKRFPDDPDILASLLGVLDAEGRFEEADRVVARVREIDPTEEIALSRALARRDYPAAIAELERLGELSVEQRAAALRISELMTRAGKSDETIETLEKALESDPEDAAARLDLADAQFAAGDLGALRRALVDAIQTGSDVEELRQAIELVEGATELTPFRREATAVVREYEASGAARIAPMPAGPSPAGDAAGADGDEAQGTASRVLDYAVLWIKGDGSARMLEHEILQMRSREAIAEHAEQQVPNGLVLKIRTIKRDGTVLEPEFVQGKPTVTMPHLEVGDYIETETIYNLRSDGNGGQSFLGPRWFFREEKLAYWWSEFVVVSPKARALVVEVTGSVPEPTVKEEGALSVRTWLVRESPALPEEPGSAPIQEFLPSVRVGYGITLADTIEQMIEAAAHLTPRDPRLVRVAELMAIGTTPTAAGRRPETASERKQVLAKISTDEKARRIYRWVVANVEPSREADGRRIVTGKSGNPTEAFIYLCRLVGIDARLGAIQSRLAPPPRGPFSEAEQFGQIAVRVGLGGERARWLVVQGKFAPYGYLPSSLRGQPAIVLAPGGPREVTPKEGSTSGVTHEGTVDLAADGSATLELTQRYEGELAIQLRSALETLPDTQLKDTIEARLLPQALPGARLESIEVLDREDLDAPLTLAMKIEMSSFAAPRDGELWLAPPFRINLGNLAMLQTRETPLYISEGLATRSVVKLRVELPKGARVLSSLEPKSLQDGDRRVEVRDRVLPDGAVMLDRLVDLPAGRIQPAQYAEFAEFATRADELTQRPVAVSLP